jgi:ECF transporter S component (folate family)
MLKKAHVLTHLALLLAIAVLLSMLGVMIPIAGINGLKITFSYLPIMLAGFVFGPAAGAIVGAMTDILGYLVKFHAYGPWFPGFTVTTALSGALPVIIYRLFKANENHKIIKLSIAVAVTSLLVTVINTYWLQILYGKAFLVILPMRILKELILIPIQIISLNIVMGIYRVLINQFSSYSIKF